MSVEMTPREHKVASASAVYLSDRADAARAAVASVSGKVARAEADLEAARVALAATIADAEQCEKEAAEQVALVADAIVVDVEQASMTAGIEAGALGATVSIVENGD